MPERTPVDTLADVIRVVLFDVDGVVRRWDPELMASAERDHDLPAGSLPLTVFEEPWLHRAVTGVLTDAEWRAGIADRLARRAQAPAAAAAAAVTQWSASPGSVDADVLEVVREQRRVRRVALLSNATDRLDDDLRRLGLLSEVDAVYNSSRLGLAKPDAALFAAVAADLGVPASECAFVDDSPAFVQGARAAGMRVHRFTGRASLLSFLAGLDVTG